MPFGIGNLSSVLVAMKIVDLSSRNEAAFTSFRKLEKKLEIIHFKTQELIKKYKVKARIL